MSENAQKIGFHGPDVKMSQFIGKNQTIDQFKLEGPRNAFSEHFQTWIIFCGLDN